MQGVHEDCGFVVGIVVNGGGRQGTTGIVGDGGGRRGTVGNRSPYEETLGMADDGRG